MVKILKPMGDHMGGKRWCFTNNVPSNLGALSISFVLEDTETFAEDNGIDDWRRCPAHNIGVTFINDMVDMVVEALNESSQSVMEVGVANREDLDAIEGIISGQTLLHDYKS